MTNPRDTEILEAILVLLGEIKTILEAIETNTEPAP